ncbi:MAG TPA: HlyD family efflux transporter periplasmic adaptor subunit [Gemmatimonadales bacterium]|nr:HlyD family efflux transporter periplasmic adaptor subunit [Gemmatimonadales bacterium]
MLMRYGVVLLLAAGCTADDTTAWGSFEADEVTIAAETAGPLRRVVVDEGAAVDSGAVLAEVDAVGFALEREELMARRTALDARLAEVTAQRMALLAQHELAVREQGRTARLVAAAAATPQQAERAEREVRVLTAQLAGTDAARAAVGREQAALDAQLAQLDDRAGRTVIRAPRRGTILVRAAEPGELMTPGRPIVVMAALDTLVFRAWVDGTQLPTLRLGTGVTVRTDAANGGLRAHPGRITWISDRAEFTPTPIQTRDERATQVYAVTVAVPNPDRTLKIGQPGELVLEDLP